MLKKLFEQSGFVLALSVIDATLFFSAASRPREKDLGGGADHPARA